MHKRPTPLVSYFFGNFSSSATAPSDMLCAQELPMRTCRCPFQRQPLCRRQAPHCQINSLAFHRIPNGYRTYADQSTQSEQSL
jgi:hypothetical protein